MAHHAYYLVAEPEEGIARAHDYAAEELGLSGSSNPDILIFRHSLFSVEDARRLADSVYRAPLLTDRKVVIVSATRFFHEAQNALLKIFEEPPEGTTIILILPAEGLLLPTLRSRLLPLSSSDAGSGAGVSAVVEAFLEADAKGREKLIAKLLDRTKSDKDEEKQAARAEAIVLVEGVLQAVHDHPREGTGPSRAREVLQLEQELLTFLPILHERSAPLKLIFEHLLLVIPTVPLKGAI